VSASPDQALAGHARCVDAEIRSWFGDWELVEPGLTSVMSWRVPPRRRVQRDALHHSFFGGVARKP
jgi:hypothetical protein